MFSRLRRQLKDVATGTDLTPSQTAVLTRLWKEGASSASALAAAERVRPQSMATILAGLDQHGLIRRAPDPDDGRRQVISLTTAGRRRAESDRRAPDPDDGRRQVISLTTAGRRRAESDRQVREEWLARAMQERYTERERRVILDALSLLQRLTD